MAKKDWRFRAFLENVICTIRKTQSKTLKMSTVRMAYVDKANDFIEMAVEGGWLEKKETIRVFDIERELAEGKNTKDVPDAQLKELLQIQLWRI